MQTVNKVHYQLDDLVHREDYECDNDGSNQHDNRALDQRRSGGPGGLIPKLGVGLFQIRK